VAFPLHKHWPFPSYRRAEYVDGMLIIHSHTPLTSISDDTLLRVHGWDRVSADCFECKIPADEVPWYLTVNQDWLFAVMRTLDTEAHNYQANAVRATTPRFAHEVGGAAWIDDVIEANCRFELLSALRNGASLDTAAEIAQTAVREHIRKHNERYADVFAHRPLEAGDGHIARIKARILSAITPLEPSHVAG
jgi:hypothetical protein